MDRPHTCVRKGEAGFEASAHDVGPVFGIERLGQRFLEIRADQPHGLQRMEVRQRRGPERNVSFDRLCQPNALADRAGSGDQLIAAHERHVHLLVDLAFVRVDLERALRGRQRGVPAHNWQSGRQ